MISAISSSVRWVCSTVLNLNAASVGTLDEDGRSDLVEAQSCVVAKDVEVPVLERVNDVEHHVGAANHVENFTASALPSAAPLMSPGRSRIWIFAPRCSMTPNTGQGGKGVTTCFGVGVGHLGDEGGFTNRWKANQSNRCITRFSDFKPFAPTAGFGVRRRLLFLDFELGDFGLQFPNVGVGGLVLLGLVDLGPNHPFALDRRQAEPSRIGAWLAVLEGSYAT